MGLLIGLMILAGAYGYNEVADMKSQLVELQKLNSDYEAQRIIKDDEQDKKLDKLLKAKPAKPPTKGMFDELAEKTIKGI